MSLGLQSYFYRPSFHVVNTLVCLSGLQNWLLTFKKKITFLLPSDLNSGSSFISRLGYLYRYQTLATNLRLTFAANSRWSSGQMDENKKIIKAIWATPTVRNPSGNTLTPSSNICSNCNNCNISSRSKATTTLEVKSWQSSCICELKAHAASSKSLNCRLLTEVSLLHLGYLGVGCCVAVAFWVWIALLRFVTDMRQRQQQQQQQAQYSGMWEHPVEHWNKLRILY